MLALSMVCMIAVGGQFIPAEGGQPPKAAAKPAAPPAKAEPNKPETVDDMIATALRNHPDIRLAEAKRLVAEAELEQAKLLVAQRITICASKIEQAKSKLEAA